MLQSAETIVIQELEAEDDESAIITEVPLEEDPDPY